MHNDKEEAYMPTTTLSATLQHLRQSIESLTPTDVSPTARFLWARTSEAPTEVDRLFDVVSSDGGAIDNYFGTRALQLTTPVVIKLQYQRPFDSATLEVIEGRIARDRELLVKTFAVPANYPPGVQVMTWTGVGSRELEPGVLRTSLQFDVVYRTDLSTT